MTSDRLGQKMGCHAEFSLCCCKYIAYGIYLAASVIVVEAVCPLGMGKFFSRAISGSSSLCVTTI